MGFNLSLLVYANALPIDLHRAVDDAGARAGAIKALFPRTAHHEIDSLQLDEGGFPERGRTNLAIFEDGLVLATRDAALFNPTKLHSRYLAHSQDRILLLLTQQSAYDMFAYARWEAGSLVRSVSVNPVGGVWESVGEPAPFEVPFWDGQHRVDDEYPLPFAPLDLSDAALRALLHLHFEGPPADGLLDPSTITLHAYERSNP